VTGPPLAPAIEVEVRSARAPRFAALVTLRGEHDLATTEQLRDALRTLLGDVLVDLSECTFVDSTTIGSLIAAAQDLDREGHELALVVPPGNEQIARTLELVRIGDVVRVLPRLPVAGG
jgi:anti-anti-sigma factor